MEKNPAEGCFKIQIKFLSQEVLKRQIAECRTSTVRDLGLSSGLTCLMRPHFIRGKTGFCYCIQIKRVLLLRINQ